MNASPVLVITNWRRLTFRLLPWMLILLCARSGGAADLMISGTALDPSGAAIGEAIVELLGPSVSQQSTTDTGGSFSFTALAPGSYELSLEASGFEPWVETIDLTESRDGMTLMLELESHSQSVEVVADTGPAGAPDPGRNADRVEITSEDLQLLPAMDGDVVGTLQSLLDGGSFGSEGGGLIVDGMESSDLGVSPSAIQEIRINKDPYSAEYSRPGRSRIEVITKKGAKELHGQLNLRLRDHKFDARNAFAAERPDQRRFAVEGHLVGPLGQGGKSSYVFSGEHDRDRSSSIVFANTPGGLFQRAVLQPEVETEVSARWDYHPSYERAFSLRYEYEQESQRNSGIGGFTLPEGASDENEKDHSVYWSYRRILSPSTIFEWSGRVGFETESEISQNQGSRLIVLDAFTAGGAQRDSQQEETYAQSSAVLSFQKGRHYVRTGLLLRDLANKRNLDRDNFGGTFRFATLADFESGQPFAYSLREGNPRLSFWDAEIAGFIQDNIRLNERSTLALGVRYDRQNYTSDPDNVAPRASLAFGVGAERRTTIRLGGGLFYDNIGSSAYEDRLRFDGVRLLDVLLLNPAYPDPSLGLGANAAPPPNLVRWAPRLKTPYVGQVGGTLERKLADNIVLSVNWTRSVGVGLLRSLDLNAPEPGVGGRPNPGTGIDRRLESSARQEAWSMRTQLRGKIGGFFSGTLRYAWGRAYNNVEDDDALPANSRDLSREWGPAGFDRRHRFDALGAFDVKDWFQLGVVLEADSASPYTLTTGSDDNGDGIAADRPMGLGRNTERGAPSTELDVRLSKKFSMPAITGRSEEPTSLALTIDAFNMLNTVNLRGFIGNLSSDLFGRPTSAGSARRLQAGLRWSF